ncbi:Aldehyde dehydrogenase family 3 member B1 [Trametes pubescens]|uniref:Aldehyde dehydrogenase n=1 Tax=Trametes pubescens TaxID=154538 RepID=A0A1M2VCD6_TRAPU|nr:Aldehyde dehydrogenase family 3 member B1 [Trametes pubescens]
MTTLTYTSLEDIPKIHERARRAFLSGKTKSIPFRKAQIAQVGYLIKDNEQRIKDALKLDLCRPEFETEFSDFTATYMDVRSSYDNVEKWSKPQKTDFNFNFFAMSPKTKAEPKGVVLLVAPFNFPVFLVFSPLVSAIAGGNAAVIKPSEQTPAFSALIAELLPQYLDNDLFHIINGGPTETTKILELRWDHIFYIAAQHLTPVTLELGGKNPVVIDPKCDVKLAARRILWGRFSNAGQTCLAPEYVLVPKTFQDKFVEALVEAYHSFYPEGPAKSASFSRIISEKHTARIKQMIDGTKGTIVVGGDTDVSQRYIAPTIVKDVRGDDSLMAEDYPLAIYVFSKDKSFQKKIFDNTQSGCAAANETVISAGVPGLPMGGIGGSGYGYYTGKHAFDEFTHLRVSLDNPGWVDKLALGVRFPPYKPSKVLALLAPGLPPRPVGGKPAAGKRWAFWLAVAVVGAASVLLTGSGAGLLEQFRKAVKLVG